MRHLVLAVTLFCCVCASPLQATMTERVSLTSSGEQFGEWSGSPSISGDGRLVVLHTGNPPTEGSIFHPGIFVRDRAAGTTERVSVSTTGELDNGTSYGGPISANGRYVVFQSQATNLVPGDTNSAWDIFIRDLQAKATERISINSAGEQADGDSMLGLGTQISADGRYVVFTSSAGNLAPGASDGTVRCYLRDRTAGTTECVSVDASGSPVTGFMPSISADGRSVAFQAGPPGTVPGDANAEWWIFVRDRVAGTTRLVSVGNDGKTLGNHCEWPAISADGRFVAFSAGVVEYSVGYAVPPEIYVRDLVAEKTEIVSVPVGDPVRDQGNGAYNPSISGDGRFVAFRSARSALVAGDTNSAFDVFVRDRANGVTVRVSVGSRGEEANAVSGYECISQDGRYVAFDSEASNLVPGDTNGTSDVFVRDWQEAPAFADVPVGYWARTEIEACSRARVVLGYGDGSFRPNLPVSRAQLAVFLARAVAGGDRLVPPALTAPTYLDVGRDHWAYEYIELCTRDQITQGVSRGAYAPDSVVDRGQMAAYLARALAYSDEQARLELLSPPTVPSFKDVPAEHWAFRYVECLKGRGTSSGYPDGLYHPEITLTRDQAAALLARGFHL